MVPERVNHALADDFAFDVCFDGQRLNCLTMVDKTCRNRLAINVASRIRSGRVIEVLAVLISARGAPRCRRSDQGAGFVATALPRWLARADIEVVLINPGKPKRNHPPGESVNGKFRDKCLSLELLRNRTDAKIVIESWRGHHNDVRPRPSLAHRTPTELKQLPLPTRPAEVVWQV